MRRSKLITVTVISAAVAILLFVGGVLAWYFLAKNKPVDPCPEGQHNFLNWEKTVRPTCNEEGKETATCSICGTQGERPIAATGRHEYTQWEILKSADFTQGGEMKRICTLCNASEETQSIPALGAGGTLTLSGEYTTLPLGDYRILYSTVTSQALNTQTATHLSAAIKAATGKTPALDTAGTGSDAKLILVGDTGRAESDAALAAIGGEGFIIRVVGDTLVIVGSNDVQTAAGVAYFTREFLSKRAADGLVRVPTSATKLHTGTATLVTHLGTQFQVVFDRSLKVDPTHAYVSSSTSDSRDHAVIVAHNLAKALGKVYGGGEGDVEFRNDSRVSDYEVLIGTADRGEVQSLLALLDGNEYAILVREDQVILTAHNDYALDRCIEKFQALLDASEGEDVNGNAVWQLPNGFYYVGVGSEQWVEDFPRPVGSGITLHSSLYLHQNALQYLYMGEGVNKAAFDAYCQTLRSSGYTLYTQSDIEGSYFATFKNATEMIYVAFNAYSHAAEEHNTDDATHRTKYPYLNYENCIRVVSAPIDQAYLVPEVLLTPNSYIKVTQSSITTVRVQDAVGHSYIITLEDGSFIFIDGGSNTAEARNNLWNSLVALHTEIFGEAPSVTNPVRMRAWYVTHSHGDHYGAFYNLLKARVPSGELKVDYLIGNFPHNSAMNSVGSGTTWMGANVGTLAGYGLQYIKVFTGQRLYFANMEMEVLMTFADHAPRLLDNSNDTNTVTRLTFNEGESGVAAKNLLVLGDSCLYQSRYLCAMYGAYLKSDMVQLAHHGNIGCEIALYKLAAPEVIWYPHSSSGYNGYVSHPGSSSWTYSVTDYVVRKLESVKYIYVSGCKGVSGTESLTLKFKADGNPDYENIYNPINGVKYTYITDSVYASPSPAIKLR